MKKVLGTLLVVALVLSMSVTAMAADEPEEIKDATELKTALEAVANASASNTVTITLKAGETIDMTGWNSFVMNKAKKSFILDGNGATLANLSGPLFAELTYGISAEIKDLTISGANISVTEVTSHTGGATAAAFVSFVGFYEDVKITNCKLLNSTVSSDKYAGGFVGVASGYSTQGDGPVFTTVTIDGCTATNNTITGGGSTGGVVGHATLNSWALFNVTETTLTGNKVTCTDSDTDKAGSVVGTIGVAGNEVHGKTGGVTVSATVSGSTVTSGGTTITTIYGRQGNENGKLTITGGVYDDHPIATGDTEWAKLGEGLVETEVNGKFYITKPGEAPKEETKPSRPSGGSSRPSGQWFTTTLEDIDKVTVGGKVLDSQYYTVAGTDVLISQEYIDKLANGSYQVVIENATHIARGTLTVKGAASVESAKTFDAGVAVYGMMAVSSAMGAAYVCTKKKH